MIVETILNLAKVNISLHVYCRSLSLSASECITGEFNMYKKHTDATNAIEQTGNRYVKSANSHFNKFSASASHCS